MTTWDNPKVLQALIYFFKVIMKYSFSVTASELSFYFLSIGYSGNIFYSILIFKRW